MRRALWIFGFVLASVVSVGCGGNQAGVVQAGKMPPGGDFDGVYQSPAYGRMEFTVDGASVLGLYEGERHWGRIEGEINGNLMSFHWTQWNADMQGKVRESSGRGYFKYKIDVEGGATTTREVHRLKGEWGYGEAETGNVWGAVKLSSRAKKRLKPYTPEEATSDIADDDYDGAAGFDESASGEMNQETEVQMSEPEPEEEESGGGVDDLFD
jgi:hypothetical protein